MEKENLPQTSRAVTKYVQMQEKMEGMTEELSHWSFQYSTAQLPQVHYHLCLSVWVWGFGLGLQPGAQRLVEVLGSKTRARADREWVMDLRRIRGR